ncbi:hypothetical protein [Breoghania sp.]|uniref:hypothetical protein n=1 Tax=Breoghania sp. TaxID=2065378 RepID=UPI00262BBE3E|nr:hypothetical protein [Breoghania sp.]MDJ0930031.1 hypothetical protein [Breoghania sp.]
MRRRQGWRAVVRPETLVLAIAAMAYGAAVVFLTLAYLSDIAPFLQVAYGDFGLSLGHALSQPWVGAWALVALLVVVSRRNLSPLAVASTLAMAGFVLAYLVQTRVGATRHCRPPAPHWSFWRICWRRAGGGILRHSPWRCPPDVATALPARSCDRRRGDGHLLAALSAGGACQ